MGRTGRGEVLLEKQNVLLLVFRSSNLPGKQLSGGEG
jgi:hypothetical protein